MSERRPEFQIGPLSPQHDRGGFSSGEVSLDRYLRTQAAQDARRLANGVFVLVDRGAPAEILGFYTLCATSLPQGDVPQIARRHVPRYPSVSATLIGRLAVSQARQGERLGSLLLADAVRRAHASAAIVGSSMLVVDALNERAGAFYVANGFLRLPDTLRFVLPMHLVERLVE